MKKKTKKRKQSKREACSYVIEIRDWEFSYSFALPWRKNAIEEPYWEFTDIKVKGKLVHPEKFVDREIDVTVMTDRWKTRVLTKPDDCRQFEPKAVGGLTIRGKESNFLGSVPFDAFQMLCSMMNAGKIKYLVLDGQSLYRGDTDIRSMRFQEHFGPEDI